MGLAKLVNEQTKAKTPAELLEEALYNQIRILNPPSQSTKANVKPSKIGCDRQMFYILTNAKADKVSTTDPKMTLIQHVGTFIHEEVQTALSQLHTERIQWVDPHEVLKLAEEKGLHTSIVETTHDSKSKYELHLYNSEWDISFQCDGFLRLDGKLYILEIKSEEHMKNMKRIGPEPQHEEQASCYSLCLGIEDVLFIYINRNYMSAKPYYFRVLNEDRDIIKEKIIRVKKSVSSKLLPPREKCKSCQYCNYKTICKADLNPLVEVS